MLFADEFDAVCHRVNTSEAALYASLTTMRNAETMATPPIGIALIMEKTGLPRRTIFRHLSRLMKAGLLTKEKQGVRAVYGFPLLNGSATDGTKECR